MSTSARTDMRTVLYNVLTAFQAANPTLIRRVAKSRPGAISEHPIAWVGGIPEPQVIHDAGTRTRLLAPTIVLADLFHESIETDFDATVDALHDHFTTNHTPTGWLYGPMAVVNVDDGELEQPGPNGSVYYRAVTFTFGTRNTPGVTVQEGRL
jgi:hypothetical protein